MRHRPVALATAAALAACGSTASSSPSAPPAAAAEPGSVTPSGDQLAAWCSLRIGQSRQEVTAIMGAPKGHRGDAAAALGRTIGIDSAEWDVGPLTLLAAFEHDKATELQAYTGTPSPDTVATGLPCRAIRDTKYPS